jgi:hypothetical protein
VTDAAGVVFLFCCRSGNVHPEPDAKVERAVEKYTLKEIPEVRHSLVNDDRRRLVRVLSGGGRGLMWCAGGDGHLQGTDQRVREYGSDSVECRMPSASDLSRHRCVPVKSMDMVRSHCIGSCAGSNQCNIGRQISISDHA